MKMPIFKKRGETVVSSRRVVTRAMDVRSIRCGVTEHAETR
jgi:hypothetical protein